MSLMTSVLRRYMAEYTDTNSWHYPIRHRVTFTSALEYGLKRCETRQIRVASEANNDHSWLSNYNGGQTDLVCPLSILEMLKSERTACQDLYCGLVIKCFVEKPKLYMSHVTRKPVIGVWDQIRLKWACSATEASQCLLTLVFSRYRHYTI